METENQPLDLTTHKSFATLARATSKTMRRYGNEDSNSSQCFHELDYERKGRDQRYKA